MNSVVWFEIPVNDMARAQKFYEAVFGLKTTPDEMGPIKMAMLPWAQGAPGAPGALVKGEGYAPCRNGTVVYFTVDEIDAALAKVNQNGGKTLIPRTSIGEHGFFAHFEDTEGNRVALHSMK
ncbi:MAG: VOC family protein [Chloroflexi bacterium]|nr:VOC family protein [Chloroflexota bacterium]